MNKLNVYILKRRWDYKYDEIIEKVVIAANEDNARRIANIAVGDEGKIWNDPMMTTCELCDLTQECELSADTFNG